MTESSRLDFGEMIEPMKILRGKSVEGKVGRRDGEDEEVGVALRVEEDDIFG